ncbi:DUF998 domain-containing protein [Infirmifilum sp. SLHALR2]|nr:MAG: hypothetical protein B7L53_02935 [Thermofilum sp. NZ13]
MKPERVFHALLFAGPLAFVVFTIGVFLASQANPWWDFFRDAFSDLGGPRASAPWIFNTTLIVVGALFSLYSLGLLGVSGSKVSSFASGLLFTAGLFLALIGVYPSGTPPHAFIPLWFYIQSYIGMCALGLGLLLERKTSCGAALLALGALPIPLAQAVEMVVGWPSVAMLELAGAIFILAAALVVLVCVFHKKE